MQIYPFDLEFNDYATGEPYFARFPFFAGGSPLEGVACGISSVFAGSMGIDFTGGQNLQRLGLFEKAGLDPGSVCGLRQIHSQTVLEVSRESPPQESADGMVCNDRRLALSVTAADCLPVYLYDTESGAFGLVHSGWKGTGIVLQAIKMMGERFGSKPGSIAAVLGPCIDSCCYKVDAGRAAGFEKNFGAGAVRRADGDFYLALKTANIQLLEGAGVKHAALCSNCSFCDPRLGSFRREGAENYTLMAALLWHLD
ncbi:MAG: polyphenol oxidase family protein [Spirochaetes bacterium]|nr:polyphenol oxidase family protein [Spirochaetota bacterium]